MMTPKYFEIGFSANISGDIKSVKDLAVAYKESPSTPAPGPLVLDINANIWCPVIEIIGCSVVCQESLALEMANHGIVIGRGEQYPVSFENVEGRARKQRPPTYVWLRPLRELLVEEISPAVGSIRSPNTGLQRVPVSGSAPTSDVFGAHQRTSLTYCGRRFVEISRRCGWDFFHFVPMDMPQYRHIGWKIDHLGKQWPPQWYPEGVEPHPSNLEEVAEMPTISVASFHAENAYRDAAEPLSEGELEELALEDAARAEEEGRTPTGFTLLGEVVYWYNHEDISEQRVQKIKRAITPHLAAALQSAEKLLLEMAAKAEMVPEVTRVNIFLDDDGPIGLWSVDVEGYIDGPCPQYGLKFQGSKLIGIGGVD